MKKRISKVLAVAMLAAMVSAVSLPVFAANTVITDSTWIGSDHVAADLANGVTEQAGTAIETLCTITATNINDNAANLDVTAYQVVKGTYKDGKLTGYVLCDSTNAAIASLEAPTTSEIATIADNIRANRTTLQGIKMTKGTGAQSNQYTANVEAGLYVVLATGAEAYVFNPAIVAVNVADANDVGNTAGNPAGNTGVDREGNDATSVSFADYWTIPTQAYLKSSTTSFNKDILGSTASPFVASENSEGDIVSKGATVYFQLDGMVVPSYSEEYAKPGVGENGVIYKIQDKMDGVAFAGINNLTVKTNTGAMTDKLDEHGDPVVNDNGTPDDDSDDYVEQVLAETVVTPTSVVVDDNGTPDDDSDDTEETVTNYTISYTNAAGNAVTGANIGTNAVGYTLQFSDAWLRANAEKNVVVTYDTVLTENAYVNYQANKTVASLSYTVDPSDNTGVEVLRDSTYHYTIEIGGNIDGTTGAKITDGTDEVDSFHNYEINKVTEALGVGENYTADATTGEYSSEDALAGATFTLYDDAAFTTVHQTKTRNATSGEWETSDTTYTTTDDGRLVFTGLDTGTYYLKETTAPAGYSLNANDYQVTITGTISDGTGDFEEGTLTAYTVTVKVKGTDGQYTQTVGTSTVEFGTDGSQTVTKPTTDVNVMDFDTVVNTVTVATTPAEVVNTHIAELPATGGVGTIVLTIVAAIGMGGFLTLYIVMKKKGQKSED